VVLFGQCFKNMDADTGMQVNFYILDNTIIVKLIAHQYFRLSSVSREWHRQVFRDRG
jgi:hypothetical protein